MKYFISSYKKIHKTNNNKIVYIYCSTKMVNEMENRLDYTIPSEVSDVS